MGRPGLSLLPVFLVLRARGRIARRRVRERAFELFVLAPLIVGAVAWVGERYLDMLRPAVLEALSEPAAAGSVVSLALALFVAPILWPGALRELYGHAALDALPVPEPSRLAVTQIAMAARALWPLAALSGVYAVLHRRAPSAGEIAGLLAGLVLLAWLDALLAAALVHCGWARAGRLLAVGAAGAFCAFGPLPALRAVLLPWGVAGASLHAALSGGATSLAASPWAATVTALLAVAAALAVVHLRWRRADLERGLAAEVGARHRASWLKLPPALDRKFGERWPGPLRALLRRDVLLVVRRFSPAVHLAAGLALTFMASAALALDARLPLEPAWRLQAMIAGATLAVLASAALVPFLLHRQLPVFWLEKATGVPLEQVWAAKVWLALLLALPGFALGAALILAFGPAPPLLRLQAVGQLLFSSFVVSSLIGLASFEIATEPLIGTLWSGLVALALASLFVLYPQGWWIWLLGYGWAAGEVAKRASRRVRLTQVAQ